MFSPENNYFQSSWELIDDKVNRYNISTLRVEIKLLL